MRTIPADILYAIRLLRRRPAFSAAAVLTLALGVGLNVAIFSAVRAVLISGLPYPSPEQLVRVSLRTTTTPEGGMTPQIPVFQFLQATSPMLRAMATSVPGQGTLSGLGDAEQINTAGISQATPLTTGLTPLAGRLFGPTDYVDTSDVVLISERLWRSRFEGSPAAVGRRLRLNGAPKTIVGVMPDAFDFNAGSDRHADIWQPLVWRDGRGSISSIVARLPRGIDLATATIEIDRLIPQLPSAPSSANAILGVSLTPLAERDRAGIRPGLLMLQGTAGFLLAIACANLANLLLTHASSRRREMGLRAALGAGRARLVRQMLIEATVLAALGSALGLLAAYASVPALVASASWALPRAGDVAVRFPELVIGLGLGLITALAASTAPAWMAAGSDVLASFRTTAQVTIPPGTRILRSGLIAIEVMLAVTILAGAGLLLNSFARVVALPMGFDATALVVGNISVASPALRSDEDRSEFMRLLRGELVSRLGVRDVAFANSMPYTGASMGPATPLSPDGRYERIASVPYRIVSPEYFETLRIPVVRGRQFAQGDEAGSDSVVIVNEQFAREFGPAAEIVGARMKFGPREATVVGVVGDTRNNDLTAPPAAALYWPMAQRPGLALTVAVRGAPVPAVERVIRATLARLDPDLAPGRVQTVESRMRSTQAERRFYVLVLMLFAALGVLLAAIGISGVTVHVVGLRSREIAIRLTLGSSPRQVTSLVVRQGLEPLIVGLAGGLIGAWWITGWLQSNRTFASQLYGITAHDAVTFATVAVCLLIVGGAACWIPARRTGRIDAASVLKGE